MTASAAEQHRRAAQRRTLGVLVASQSLGGLGNTVGIAVAAVLAREVSGSESLAGLVQTMQVVGAALASYLLARLMRGRGRRAGLVTGYLVGSAGAALCVLAGVVGSFAVLLAGAVMLGANSATGYQARYAAADLAQAHERARHLSVVMWATTFGAVLGPNLVGPAGDLAVAWGLPRLTGPFLVSVVVVLLASGVLAVALRPDPLLLSRVLAAQVEPASSGREAVPADGRSAWRRAVALARERPTIGAATLAMASAHAVMVAVMVMTPLHMDAGGATIEVIGVVISIHVLGMFFFSPLVGMLADSAGSAPTLLVGAVVLGGSLWLSGTSHEGASPRIGVGLFLLGLGWSICTVAASALLVEATPLEARTDVQGVADLLMNAAAAVAGALAGVVVDRLGFGALNVFAGVLTVGVLAAASVAQRATEPRAA